MLHHLIWRISTSCRNILWSRYWFARHWSKSGCTCCVGLIEKCEVKAGSTVTFENLFTSLPLLDELTKFGVFKHIQVGIDVFKTSSGRLKKVTTSYDQTRRLHNVWQKTSDLCHLEDVQFITCWRCVWLPMPWRHLIYAILKTSDLPRLEDVWFTTSWRCLIYDVLKTSDLQHVEDIAFTLFRKPIYDVLKTSDLWRAEDVLKMVSVEQCVSDVYTVSKEIVFSYHPLSEIFRKFHVCCLG